MYYNLYIIKYIMSLSELEVAELKNIIKVKDVIRRSENPNPLVIVVIILVTILVMFVIYIQFIKKSISGLWVDAENKKHKLDHNKWKDIITVDKNEGIIKSNLVVLYVNNTINIGIWSNDKINWNDGSVWHCYYGE